MIRSGSLLFRFRRLPFAAGACALLAALSACSSAPPLFLKDGRQTIQVQCPAAGDQDSCVQQARARCASAGYDKVDASINGDTYTLVFACRAQ
jgi:hypothetical protein